MTRVLTQRIDVEAAQALAHWKAWFSDEVVRLARQRAADSEHPQRVTVADYRSAAQQAIERFAAVVCVVGDSDAERQVA